MSAGIGIGLRAQPGLQRRAATAAELANPVARPEPSRAARSKRARSSAALKRASSVAVQHAGGALTRRARLVERLEVAA
jgi:hypothetical protein